MEGQESPTKNGSSKKGNSSKGAKTGKTSKSKKDKDKSSSSGKKDKKDKSKDKERTSGGSSTRNRDKDGSNRSNRSAMSEKDDFPLPSPKPSPKPKRDKDNSQRSSKSPRSGRRKGRSKSGRKGVYFNKSVYVNTIPNLESYKAQEIDSVWFTPDEYAAMEQECDETAAVMDASRPLAPSQCPRGLEAWTAEGEQNKEANVQEAIESVWQAQLEQWQMAQDTNECWEFIRGEYLPTSERCIQLAHHLALRDEESIQAYLNTTRQVFSQFARRVLGKAGGSKKIVRRSVNEGASTPRSGNRRTLGARQSSQRSISSGKSASSSRDASLRLSQLAINGTLKSSLKAPSAFIPDDTTIDEDGSILSKSDRSSGSRRVSRRPVKTSSPATITDNSDIKSVGSLSYASTIESVASASVISAGSGSRKISFRPKSKTKIPTSPVGSVADGSIMDESTNSRRMRSHMSVCSDDSTRRRMRKVVPKPLL